VAHLRHPNIVQMYDFNHDGDLYYMVMEYVMGETLQTRLKRLNASRRRLSVKEVISFTGEICEAAYYAHQRGMIHRDIKPANIMLDVNGRAILMDFGIARMVGGSQHTATGAVLGTAMYMSPEQIQGLQIDARADIYSIGITLYEMLSGKPPFEADSAMTLMMMHLNDPVPDLHALYPEVPAELVAITNKALAKSREGRYQSASEMANALRKLPEELQKAPVGVIQATQSLPAAPEATMIEGTVVKDTGETLAEVPGRVTPAKEPSKPVTPLVKPAAEAQYQPTLVEQAIQASEPTAALAVEAKAERLPVEGRRSKAWIPILAVLLILILGGGGYFAYTKLIAGGEGKTSLPSATAGIAAVLPVPATHEAMVEASPTLRPTATQIKAAETPIKIPPSSPYTCTDPIGCVKIGPSDPIHIAYLLAIAGPNAALGIDSRNGVDIAIDDAGTKILGHAIRFDGVDGGCSKARGQFAGNKLASDTTIVAVIGTSCTTEANAADPLLSAAGFVIISPSNSASDLTDPTSPNHYAGYFRTAHNDMVQGAAAADFVYNFLKFNKAATIRDGSMYADKLTEVFRNEFVKLGGTITVAAYVNPNATDITSVLTTVAAGDPQIIYFPVFLPTGAYIIDQAKANPGLDTTQLMGADGLFSPDVMKAAGDSIEGFMVSSPIFQGAAYDEFLAKYNAKFGMAPVSNFHAQAYDAFNILKSAIEKVVVQEADGTIYIPRQALRDAVAATKDFNGLTGILTCNSNGDCANPIIGVHEYHIGQFPPTLIWSTEYRKLPANPFKVGLVTEIGKIDDKSFNQTAWEGVQRALAEGNADFIQYIETSSSMDYDKNIATFADAVYNIIVTVGFNLADATYNAAKKYPDVYFIGVDQALTRDDKHPDWPLTNLVSINFNEDQSGFLVGALGAMMSASHKLGAVCGTNAIPPVWRYGEGYKAGAAYEDAKNGTNTEVTVVYHSDVGFDKAFGDPIWGAETANRLIDSGIDIIFGCGGKTGDGAINAAAQRRVYAIGVDTDQYYTMPEAASQLLSSALKLESEPIAKVIALTKEGKFPIAGSYIGPSGFAPYHDLDSKVPLNVKTEMEAILKGLIDGSIKTNVLPSKPVQ